MSTMSSDMSLMDLLFDREDPMLKDAVKHESVLMDDDCRDDAIVVSWAPGFENWLQILIKKKNCQQLLNRSRNYLFLFFSFL